MGSQHIRNYIGRGDLALTLPSIRELRKIGISAKLESPNYDIHQPKCLMHPYKNWQEERRHKLTASTFAGAVGFWRGRRVQLWLEKIGAIDFIPENREAIWWSNTQEQDALKQYSVITGRCVRFTEFQIYRDNESEEDWLAASPDGVVDPVFYGLPSRGVLEIKCPYFGGDKQALPWKRIPLYCIPQAQGLMEILDRDWMDFYVWTLSGSSLFRIHRDPEYWDALKIVLSDFWFKQVKPAREVFYSRHTTLDSLTIALLRPFKPRRRHELFADIVRKSKRIVDRSPLLVREIGGKIVDEYI